MNTKRIIILVLGVFLSQKAAFCASRSEAKLAETKDTSLLNGNPDVNTMTDMIQNICKRVKSFRDSIITINLDDTKSIEDAKVTIKNFEAPIKELQDFIALKKQNVPDFINQLNDEGMPPRIIEGELELSLRHDLEAVSITLGLGTYRESYDLWHLQAIEIDIYDSIENLSGPLIRLKNLKNRYAAYLEFFQENKKMTQQETHVILHIATYVISVREALALADQDGGRYLLNLLKTYVEWLPEATHMEEDMEVIKQHGSIMGIADKNNKTMLDWTKELIDTVNQKRLELSEAKKPTTSFGDAGKQLRKFATILQRGLTQREGEKLKKITTRTLDPNTRTVRKKPGEPYTRYYKTDEEMRTDRKMKSLDLATERNLDEVARTAEEKFPSREEESSD